MAGIKYREIYPLKNKTDGTTNYKEIDFNNQKVTIYNKDFDLSREGNTAVITELPRGEVWNKNEASSSPVIKKEYLNHISDEPKVDVYVEFDRGSAAGFENHLRLSEANTLEDLENLGNNYFNLSEG